MFHIYLLVRTVIGHRVLNVQHIVVCLPKDILRLYFRQKSISFHYQSCAHCCILYHLCIRHYRKRSGCQYRWHCWIFGCLPSSNFVLRLQILLVARQKLMTKFCIFSSLIDNDILNNMSDSWYGPDYTSEENN